MINKKFKAITPHGSLLYEGFILKSRVCNLKGYMDYTKFSELCKSGCVNYGKKWSCPPYSPLFEEFTKGYSYISICLLHIKLQQFSYIKNDYLKVKAANSILKSRIDKTLRKLKRPDNHYISTGSCRMCKPCKCKLDKPCAHNDIKTYSFEALGVDVSNMVKDLFDFKLLWYRKKNVPEYTSVVAGLLSNEIIDENIIFEILKKQN